MILHDMVAIFGGRTQPPRSSTLQGFRKLTSEGETGGMDGKRTSELSDPASAINWPQGASGELGKAKGSLNHRTMRY